MGAEEAGCVGGRLYQVAAFAYKDIPQPGLSVMSCVCPYPQSSKTSCGRGRERAPPCILNAVGTEAAWHSLCGF